MGAVHPHFLQMPFTSTNTPPAIRRRWRFREKILREGSTARDAYMELLAAGDSDYPIELLKGAGVDMSRPDVVESAMETFRGLMTISWRNWYKMIKKFHIFANGDETSAQIVQEVRSKMVAAGAEFSEDEKKADLIFCIGGDGALLRLLRQYDFPEAPIVGINTGHLGFFQEITVDGIDELIRMLAHGDYHIQENSALSAEICTESETKQITAINEIVIRGEGERLMHLDMSIGENYISRFSGDGIECCHAGGQHGV